MIYFLFFLVVIEGIVIALMVYEYKQQRKLHESFSHDQEVRIRAIERKLGLRDGVFGKPVDKESK
jgi:hypothetical protein